MSANIALQAQDCCAPCTSPVVENVPGPQGAAGTNGTNGTNGVDSFTTTTAAYTQPAVAALVSVAVVTSAWAVIGQVVYVQNGGYYTVDSIPDATHLSLRNLGYAGNAAPAAVIGGGQKVGPGGLKGTDGVAVGVTLNSISPTTTRGDILVDDGANAPLASDVRFPAGTDGQQLTALAAQPTGLIYRTITPNAATDNVVPRFDASGATTPTPLQSSGIQITDTTAIQTTAGNARGVSAVDLQPVRGAATQVASGDNSTIGGGLNNTASGDKSVVSGGEGNAASTIYSSIAGGLNNSADNRASVGGGEGNAASGNSSVISGGANNVASAVLATVGGGQLNSATLSQATVAGGGSNTASGSSSTVGGGDNNTAGGSYSTVPGGRQASAPLYGQVAHASGQFAAIGDAQVSELIWRGATTNATPTEIFLNGAAIRATVPNNTTWAFSILATARRDNGTSVIFKVEGGIKNDAGVVVLVAGITTTVVSDGSGGALVAGSFVASADDPNNALIITTTGVAGQNWRWCAHARLVELAY